MNKITLLIILILLSYSIGYAQLTTYIGPGVKMYTYDSSNLVFFGDLINDEPGGLNFHDGGTVYFYRNSSTGTGNIRIMSGPSAPVSSGDYNDGGAYIKVYNLITDNTQGTASPSGTEINTNSGAGDIQIEQEVQVYNKHTFTNGMVWTPRDKWRTAYLHYLDTAVYLGNAANNTSGMHVDGYVAYTGTNDFMFPIGDGQQLRMAGVKSPTSGTYRAAYFDKNALNGTAGISGPSASTTVLNGNLQVIDTSEFWDIDGTAETKIMLTALNSGNNTSEWAQNFQGWDLNSNQVDLVITGWDDWENLDVETSPTSFAQDGVFTTGIAVIPDSSAISGSPYSAFTWAIEYVSNTPVKDLKFNVYNDDCKALLKWRTEQEVNTTYVDVFKKRGNNDFEKIAVVPTIGNTVGFTEYNYVDEYILNGETYIYRIDLYNLDGTLEVSEVTSFESNCTQHVDWKIYPNPSETGLVRIEASQVQNVKGIGVYDAAGQLAYYVEPEGRAETFVGADLNLSQLSEGFYYIVLSSEEGETVHSFQIKIN